LLSPRREVRRGKNQTRPEDVSLKKKNQERRNPKDVSTVPRHGQKKGKGRAKEMGKRKKTHRAKNGSGKRTNRQTGKKKKGNLAHKL